MTIAKAFVIVVASTVAFAIGGATLGWFLGATYPSYYRAMFPQAAQRPDFDAIQVGMGLGLTQGAGAGVAVGLGVVAAVTWYALRRPAGPRADPAAGR